MTGPAKPKRGRVRKRKGASKGVSRPRPEPAARPVAEAPRPWEPNARQAMFLHLTLRPGMTAKKAGELAGYAENYVYEVLRKAESSGWLARERMRAGLMVSFTAAQIAEEAAAIGFADISDVCGWGPDGFRLYRSEELSEETRRAIKRITVDEKVLVVKARKGEAEDGETVAEQLVKRRITVEMHGKVQALALMADLTEAKVAPADRKPVGRPRLRIVRGGA